MTISDVTGNTVMLGLLHNVGRHEPVRIVLPSMHQSLVAEGLIEWADAGWSRLWRWIWRLPARRRFRRERYAWVRLTVLGRKVVAQHPISRRSRMACDLIVPEPIPQPQVPLPALSPR